MLSKEENELLVRVSRGQPVGEVFRRFWLPVVLSEEVPGLDCVPVRIRLLGEDLVAFRDTAGKVGVFDAYCPHRNAPLFFGRNEEHGLRCVYHGWKFDTDGNCVDMPNVPEGAHFKDRVKIESYPTFEGGGMVWCYMGPTDKIPPKPGYDWIDLPAGNYFVTKYYINCNYLQTLENEFDPGHSAFLHSALNGGQSNGTRPTADGMSIEERRQMRYEVVDTDYGAAMARAAGGGPLALSMHFMMPSFSTAGAVSAPNTHPLNIKIPVDDENTVFFRFKWSPDPIEPDVRYQWMHAHREFPEQIPGTYVTKANKSNDYLIDRNKQRWFNYTGIDPYPVQDFAMQEDQRGTVADRSRETLVSSDRYLIYVRRKLMNAARGLMEGREPQEPWRPEAYKGIRNFKVLTPEEARKVRPLRESQAIAVEAGS